MRKRLRLLAPIAAAGLVAAAACAPDNDGEDGSGGDGSGDFPRHETLFTGGDQWGPPSSWNPLQGGGQVPGARGLLYETLFLFNPNTLELEPWLAESGEWTAEDVYQLVLRDNLEWTDGTALTAQDVAFTVELGQMEAVPYANVWDWLGSIEVVDDQTVEFTFDEPRRGEWDNFVSSNQIVPEHIFGEMSEDEVVSAANENPVGSGAYQYHSHNDDRHVFERNDDWWGIDALGLEMSPKYIIDLVNPSNEVAFGQILQNQLDISNFFLPGIEEVVGDEFNVHTYYDGEPYMRAANTSYLIPNHEREPMDDPSLRRALAHSIDVDAIVENVYGGIVSNADPTGLLPAWDPYIDDAVVSEHGFSYDPDEADQLLADAGYSDEDGDGFVETPDGDSFELTLIVPAGWTDWNEAADVIADNARAVGINVVTDFPEAATLDDMRNSGDYDLVVNNWTNMSNTPWTNFDYLFQLPVRDTMGNSNFARYENEQAWALTEELGAMSVGDDGFQEAMSQLQEIALTEMPAIPLWYNGMWSQVNHSTWTNWPSEAEDTPDAYPTTWNGFYELGAVKMFAELEPAAG